MIADMLIGLSQEQSEELLDLARIRVMPSCK